MRFKELLDDIENLSIVNEGEGEKGKWIKATKHTEEYNKRYPNHIDKTGFKWLEEVVNEYKKRNIIIFEIGGENWFVLPKYEVDFKTTYPFPKAKYRNY